MKNKSTILKEWFTGLKRKMSETTSIDKKDKLIKEILYVLQSNYRGESTVVEDKILVLFILDRLFYDSIMGSDFKESLIDIISYEADLHFKDIEIKPGPLPEKSGASVVFPDEAYITIISVKTGQGARKAYIMSVKDNGSTIKSKYILDSEDIVKQPDCRYNIGIGKHPAMPDSHRENYIAIDDSAESPYYEQNKYVSRSHANISFSEEFGFMLNVEIRGTRVFGKRTYIQRGNEKIELDNPLTPVPLHNGDYIILSNIVHLLFKEI